MTNEEIAVILHMAADRYLAKNQRDLKRYRIRDKPRSIYSCGAVFEALRDKPYESRILFLNKISSYMKQMGLNTNSLNEFGEFRGKGYACTPRSQNARYLWLKWCALMVEEGLFNEN